MADTTAVSVARTALYDALRASQALAQWRVHRVVPRQIAAPTIYIDDNEFDEDESNNGTTVIVSFPVIIVHDGAVRAQVEAMDDISAHVWDAALTVGRPRNARAVNLDVGGPTLRSKAMRVEIPVLAYTMCPSTLVIPEPIRS